MTLTRAPNLIPTSLDGNLRRGGWLLSGIVEGDTDAIAKTQSIRTMGKSLATSIDADWREWFNGHALAEPDFRFTRYGSQAAWRAGTADAYLRGEALQDISFADVASPANSHEATSWNFGEVIEHILQFHCNYIYDATGAAGSPDGIITETDIDTTNSTTFTTFIVRQSTNLWRSLQQIGGGEEGGGEFYRVWFNRANKLFYQPAPPFISPQPTIKGTITKEHLRGQVMVKFHNSNPGQAYGQVAIKAVASPTQIYTSKYPATTPLDGKILKKEAGIWANSQARTDTLAERLYKWLTRSYTLTVEVDAGLVLFGDDGAGLDLGDRILVTYDGPTEDADTGAGVHLDLNAQSMYIYAVKVNLAAAQGRATATLVLEHDNS